MAASLYSIVMPTRDRADTLHFAIKTVLKSTCSNYELVVMDNCGSPETRQVVEAFASPRIRYFRSPERLSLADNWERALERATGDYITFLGDDDGLMPDALEIAERFHARWPDEILSWWPFTWTWPDCVASGYENLAQMHFGNSVRAYDSRKFLKQVFSYEKDYTSLPTLYCSFVPRRLIDEMRSAHGRYFLASLPDVFSGIANLISTDRFFYSYRPLTCWGISRHSTGAGQFFQTGAAREQLDRERNMADDPWHKRLSRADLIVEVRIVDLYLKVKEKLFPHDDDLHVDLAALLRTVSTASARRIRSNWSEVRAAVEEMARKNGLDPADFPVAPPMEEGLDRFGFSHVPGEPSVTRYHHFTNPETIRTIEDFVDYASRMCLPQHRLLFPDDQAAPAQPQPGLLRRLASSARGRARRAGLVR